MKQATNGKFIISLDFELMWGVHDSRSIEDYGSQIKAVHIILPRLLTLFDRFKIHGTFATVGFLFAKSQEDLNNFIPSELPTYENFKFSPYTNYLQDVCAKEDEELHFCNDLINVIQQSGNQEVCTHTFSHYYCLEDGQSLTQFEADLVSAINIAKRDGIELKSIVFPRNQFNSEYLKVAKNLGIDSYRGNENSSIYRSSKGEDQSKFRRARRLIDAYFNITGHHTFSIENAKIDEPVNIPSSRFLRPYSTKLSFLENRKLKRIKKAMTHAARNNEVFHLWWHPHNFGSNTDDNFKQLEEILSHYEKLNKEFDFQSMTMTEATEELTSKADQHA